MKVTQHKSYLGPLSINGSLLFLSVFVKMKGISMVYFRTDQRLTNRQAWNIWDTAIYDNIKSANI